jgi:hypothetical protein
MEEECDRFVLSLSAVMGEEADSMSALGDPDWWRSVFSLSGWWREHGHSASCLFLSVVVDLALFLSAVHAGNAVEPSDTTFLVECMGPYSSYPLWSGGGAGRNQGEIVSFGIQPTVGRL